MRADAEIKQIFTSEHVPLSALGISGVIKLGIKNDPSTKKD